MYQKPIHMAARLFQLHDINITDVFFFASHCWVA